MPDHPPPPGLLDDLEQASWQTLAGEAADVADELASRLRSDADSGEAAQLAITFYLAVAQTRAHQRLAAARSATRALELADLLHAPGWAANALAVRASAHHSRGAPVEAVADLVRAEYELTRCMDPHLSAWGHQWLGLAYEEISLFELAAPHYQRSLEVGAELPTRWRSMVADELSAAGLHSALATELQMLGSSDSRNRRELTRARSDAHAYAEAACSQTGTSVGTLRLVHARLVRAQNGPDDQATGRAAELEHVRLAMIEAGDDAGAVVATASLAEVLMVAGSTARANAEAHRALDGLDPERSDLRGRFVTWLYLWVLAQQGDHAAAAGLRAVGATARTWWSHRLGRLAAMRAAIDSYALAVDGERHRADARLDPLTELGNRRLFDELISASAGQHVTLVMVDLNNLKTVNDTWGHQAGDAMLVAVAQVLLDTTRHTDHATRIGGDEFAVILRDADQTHGETAESRIHDGIAQLARAAADPALAQLSVSTGSASTSEGLAVESLMGRADERMYEAKRNARRGQSTGNGADRSSAASAGERPAPSSGTPTSPPRPGSASSGVPVA